MNLFEVETTKGKVYATGRDEFEARDKATAYLKERYFSDGSAMVTSVKFFAEAQPNRTQNKFIH
ncbi:hypothetical protein [Mongoliibacter ruber]|uniref:Uncharacterized protein n=1 Tax=Mongoliibacter ruber TaxID=1750599 RepID=A0A2T0WV65_9BACT|nr:hypothetical protein [Mongoliibacter ruber]PRY90570.1 hypothetical protein CLW00_101233 [Mongoliibacter ruber]